VAWLRQELIDLEFRVSVIDGDEVERDLELALGELTPDDDVFVHVSGRLVDRGVVRTADGRWVRLAALADILATHPAARVSLFAELLYGGPEDARIASAHVAAIVGDLAAQARGYTMLAAVRAAAASIEGLAMTRLVREVARSVHPHGALLSPAVYERIAEKPESRACAQSFTFVPGFGKRKLSASPSPTPPALPALESLPSFESEPPPERESHSPAQVAPLPLADPIAEEPAVEFASALSLRSSVRHAQQARRVVDLRRERLRTIESGPARVRELLAIARTLQVELNDAEGAIAALEEARAIDPMRVGVLQALRRGFERVGRWEKAIDAIGALAELSVSPTDRAELRLAQGRIALDRLHDQERALAWLQTALENDPTNQRALEAFDALCTRRAQSHHAAGEQGEAPAEPEVAASANPAYEPTDPAAYLNAFAVHWREGRTDAAFLAALALEELDACDVDQQILVDQFRSVVPIRARGTLDATAWELLCAPQSDPMLAKVFGQVARAAVATRLDQLVARRRLVALDPGARLDESSTASVVRSFRWAARVLGVDCPALYVVDPVPGDIAAVRAHQPSTAVGPSVLRGRSAKDLAFLAGRHLTYYRPEHQVVVYFPTSADLRRLLMATIELGAPGATGAAKDSAVAGLRDRLNQRVTDAERVAITAAARHLDPQADLTAWARGVELSAGRAGLLLCGDLATATAIVRTETRPIAGLTPEDRRRDLVAFCASAEHVELRTRCAVTAPESLQPPAPKSPASAWPPRSADPPQNPP
jgi:tetratricopeptide (TPR) repeat protein